MEYAYNYFVWTTQQYSTGTSLINRDKLALQTNRKFGLFAHLDKSIMVTISKEENILTLVSIFTVIPDNQDKLLSLLVSCTDEFVSHCPGFISASFHKGVDGTSVVLYAQYQDMNAFHTVINSEGGKRMITEGSALAESSQRFFCTVNDAREAS